MKFFHYYKMYFMLNVLLQSLIYTTIATTITIAIKWSECIRRMAKNRRYRMCEMLHKKFSPTRSTSIVLHTWAHATLILTLINSHTRKQTNQRTNERALFGFSGLQCKLSAGIWGLMISKLSNSSKCSIVQRSLYSKLLLFLLKKNIPLPGYSMRKLH